MLPGRSCFNYNSAHQHHSILYYYCSFSIHSFAWSLLWLFPSSYFWVCLFCSSSSQERDKLSSKTSKCNFLGYNSAHKRYRCYDPITKRLRIVRHVSFFEKVLTIIFFQREFSFFDTSTSAESSTQHVPIYTRSPPTYTLSVTNSSTHWVFFLSYEWYCYWYAAYACSNFTRWSAFSS